MMWRWLVGIRRTGSHRLATFYSRPRRTKCPSCTVVTVATYSFLQLCLFFLGGMSICSRRGCFSVCRAPQSSLRKPSPLESLDPGISRPGC